MAGLAGLASTAGQAAAGVASSLLEPLARIGNVWSVRLIGLFNYKLSNELMGVLLAGAWGDLGIGARISWRRAL